MVYISPASFERSNSREYGTEDEQVFNISSWNDLFLLRNIFLMVL